MKILKIGETYWILSGHGVPFQGILSEIVNNGRTALFGGIPRKVTSVYKSKTEAEKVNKY